MIRRMSTWIWVCCLILTSTPHVASAGPMLTVGTEGANYTSLQDALAAVTVQDTTIQFIDSAVYNETSAPSLGGSGPDWQDARLGARALAVGPNHDVPAAPSTLCCVIRGGLEAAWRQWRFTG